MGICFAIRLAAIGRLLALGLIGVTFLAGCSTTRLAVHKVDPNSAATRVGTQYSLMYTAFDIEITRRIGACTTSAEVYFKADIKQLESRPDPHHSYVLDPNSLASWIKTSEVKLEYFPSGGPKTLNVTAEDKGGTAIVNAASLFPLMGTISGSSGGKSPSICTDIVNSALKKIGSLNIEANTAKNLVESLTDDIKMLMVKVGALGGQPDAATKRLLSQRYDALQRANATHATKTGELAKQLKVVTDVYRTVWPRDGDVLTGVHPLDSKVLNSWIIKVDDKTRAQFTVAFSINPISPGIHARNGTTEQPVETNYGIPYRPPVAGVVRVCQGKACPTQDVDKEVLVSYLNSNILQLGRVYYLECISRPFSSIGCSFELTETGQIKSMGTMHKAALAEGATNAAKGVVEQIAVMKKDFDEATLKKTEARVKLLKAEADLAAAEKAMLPNDTADKTKVLQAETELLKGELAKLEAEEALRQARISATGVNR